MRALLLVLIHGDGLTRCAGACWAVRAVPVSALGLKSESPAYLLQVAGLCPWKDQTGKL